MSLHQSSEYDQVIPCLSLFLAISRVFFGTKFLSRWFLFFVGCKVNWRTIPTNVALLSKICLSGIVLGSCEALTFTSLSASSAILSVQPCHDRFLLPLYAVCFHFCIILKRYMVERGILELNLTNIDMVIQPAKNWLGTYPTVVICRSWLLWCSSIRVPPIPFWKNKPTYN